MNMNVKDGSGSRARTTSALIRFGRFASMTALALTCAAMMACSPTSESTGASSAGGAIDGPLDAAEMKSAIAAMIRDTDTLNRNRRAIQLIDALSDSNLDAAIEAYEEDLARVDPNEVRLFTNAWAKRDPKAAVERILEWPYPRILAEGVEEAVLVWARSDDAASARAFVDPSMSAAQEKGRSPKKFMVVAVLKALAGAQKHDELTALLENIKEEGGRDLLLTQTMIEMNRTGGLTSIQEWAGKIPWEAKNELKTAVLRRGLDWTGKLSGPGAAFWYEEIESHPRATEVLPALVIGWGVRAPEEVIPWLAKRPQSSVRDQLIRQTAMGWLTRKPAAANEWLMAHLDTDLMRDRLIPPLASYRITTREFEEAVEFIEQIQNPVEQDYALTVALYEWARLDKPAADAYIASGKVSDKVETEVRRKLALNPIGSQRRPAKANSPSNGDGEQG